MFLVYLLRHVGSTNHDYPLRSLLSKRRRQIILFGKDASRFQSALTLNVIHWMESVKLPPEKPRGSGFRGDCSQSLVIRTARPNCTPLLGTFVENVCASLQLVTISVRKLVLEHQL